jgi:hypothetical protein
MTSSDFIQISDDAHPQGGLTINFPGIEPFFYMSMGNNITIAVTYVNQGAETFQTRFDLDVVAGKVLVSNVKINP